MAVDAIGIMEAMLETVEEDMKAPFQFYKVHNACGHDTVDPIWDGLATHPMATAEDGFRVNTWPCFDCVARKLFADQGMSPEAIEAALADMERDSQQRGYAPPDKVD